MDRIAEGSSLHQVEHGEGRPLLVLHGLPLDHRYMEACLEPVFVGRADWKRLYLDLPGHGRSPAEASISSNDGMVESVVRHIERSVLRGPIAVAGLSYGGYLARGVARRLRERLAGLLLWAPSRYPREERHPAPRTLLRDDPALVASATPEEARFVRMLTEPTPAGLDAIRNLIVPAVRLADHQFLDRVAGSRLSLDPEAEPIGCPTLIVCGRQDASVGYRDAWELVERYPRATFAVLDGAGHLLGSAEEVDLFRRLVGEWLDRIDRLPAAPRGGRRRAAD